MERDQWSRTRLVCVFMFVKGLNHIIGNFNILVQLGLLSIFSLKYTRLFREGAWVIQVVVDYGYKDNLT